jgi:hypothetical protein
VPFLYCKRGFDHGWCDIDWRADRFAVKKLFWKTERKNQTNKTGGKQNEN